MTASTPASPAPGKRFVWLAAKLLLGVVAVWLLGDFVYSRVIASQVQAWEETVKRDADGVLIGCQPYNLGPADGNATALLLVHGINASPRNWEKIAPRLAGEGVHCRVMRLPGFCEPLDRYQATSRDRWQESIRAELSTLRQTHKRVGVVAHSLGGASTIGALIEDPAAADFAVLLAPALRVSDARSPVLSTRSWHEIGKRTLLFTTVMKSPFDIDSHDPANMNYPGRCPFTPRSVVDELFLLMDENDEKKEQFGTPLLMVLTEDDQVIDWQAAQRFYEQVPSPRKQLLMLEDSGHAIQIDYGWQTTAHAILEFAEP